MNTKTTKFLAVLAVLAFAFAVFAVCPSTDSDAADAGITTTAVKGPVAEFSTGSAVGLYDSYTVTQSGSEVTVKMTGLKAHTNSQNYIAYWTGLGFTFNGTSASDVTKMKFYYSDEAFVIDDVDWDNVDLSDLDEWADDYTKDPSARTNLEGAWILTPNTYTEMYIAIQWCNNSTAVATTDVYHVTLSTTVAKSVYELKTAVTLAGYFPMGAKVTEGDDTLVTFKNYTGEFTVGKNTLYLDAFSGTITPNVTDGTMEIATWTNGSVEVVKGAHDAKTASAEEKYYLSIAANARSGAGATSWLTVDAGQYLYTEMTATATDAAKDLVIENEGTITFGAAVAITGAVENNGIIDVSEAGATLADEVYVIGSGTFRVGETNLTIPGGEFQNNVVFTENIDTYSDKTTADDVIDIIDNLAQSPYQLAATLTIAGGAVYTGTVTYEQTFTYATNMTGTYKAFVAEMNLMGGISNEIPAGLTVTTGSLKIVGMMDGSYSQSYFAGYSKDVFIDDLDVASGTLTIRGEVTIATALNLLMATVNVTKEANLTIGSEAQITLDDGSILYIDGTVSLDDLEQEAVPIAAADDNDGAIIKVSETGVLNPIIIAKLPSTIKLVTEGGMEIQYVYDTALGVHDYPANQILIVDGSWTLADTAVINVSGRLIVPFGSTLVIESGAELNLYDKAKFIVEGTLTIDNPETEEGTPGEVNIVEGEMTVSGIVSDAGFVNLDQDMALTILDGGKFTVESNGAVTYDEGAEFTVSSGAELIVKGCIDGVAVMNMGYVLINSSYAAQAPAVIDHLLKGAVTEVKLYTAQAGGIAFLEITDADLRISSYRDTETHETRYVTIDDNNAITLYGILKNGTATVTDPDYNIEISNIIVTSDSDKTASTVTMYIEGTLQADYIYVGDDVGVTTYTATAGITATAGSAGASMKVVDDLRITDNTSFSLWGGNMYLTGTLSTQSSIATFTMSEDATLTVTDDGIASIYGAAISSEKGVNATKIIIPVQVDSKTVKVYTYMSIDNALAYLASTEDEVGEANVLGAQTMTETNTLGGQDTLIVTGKLTIGKTNGSDVKLTIAEDSTLKGAGYVYVNGTLYAEDKSDVKIKDAFISADVKTVQVDEKGKEVKNGWAKWTNILTAIKETEQGDVIITRDGTSSTLPKYVYLTSNLTIPAGVNLVIPTGAADIVINDGVTLVIDGSVEIGAGSNIKAQTAFNLIAYKITTGGKGYSSAIVVNGALTSAYKIFYADGNYLTASNTDDTLYQPLVNRTAAQEVGAPIAGAYYVLSDGTYVISSMEVAMAAVELIDGDITVNGNVKAGEIAFTATEYTRNIVVGGTVAQYREYGSGLVNIDNEFTAIMLGITCPEDIAAATFQIADDAEFNGVIVTEKSGMTIVGVSEMTVTVKDGKAAVVTGDFDMSDKGDIFEIASGEVVFNGVTPVMADNAVTFVEIVSESTLTIDGASTLENVYVDGTLNVPATKMLTVTGVIDIDGSVVVVEQTPTSAPGSFTLKGTMYIGIYNDDWTAASAATYSGPMTVDADSEVYVYLYSGATISGGIEEALDNMNSTAFVVEDDLWFTAFTNAADGTVTVSAVPVPNAELDGWSTTDGGARINFGTATDPNYYTVKNIGTYDVLYAVLDYDLYTIYVLADQGVHNVSIDGKLMESAPYGSDTFLMRGIDAGTHTVTYTLLDGYEGTAVMKLQKSDNDVTLMGLNFTISGDVAGETYLQLTGITPVEPEPVPPEEKEEWTITTILLCVLVVLIAIMAVIVALRLNRN